MPLVIPPSGQVDVWIAKTQVLSDRESNECMAILNETERTRLARFLVEDAKLQFLIARCLLRSTLSRYEHKRPDEWVFITNAYGRPRLADGQIIKPLHFNLSHTAGMVACAISRSEDIGIDIENIERRVNTLQLAKGAFARTEIERLTLLNGIGERELFFRLWTLKEAYIKARGMGLSLSLKEFWFEFGKDKNVARIAFSQELQDDPERWHFKLFSPTKMHRLAIAASFAPNSTDIMANFRLLSVPQIFENNTPPLLAPDFGLPR
jgi:4'-phosphopantetheinyl transferase